MLSGIKKLLSLSWLLFSPLLPQMISRVLATARQSGAAATRALMTKASWSGASQGLAVGAGVCALGYTGAAHGAIGTRTLCAAAADAAPTFKMGMCQIMIGDVRGMRAWGAGAVVRGVFVGGAVVLAGVCDCGWCGGVRHRPPPPASPATSRAKLNTTILSPRATTHISQRSRTTAASSWSNQPLSQTIPPQPTHHRPTTRRSPSLSPPHRTRRPTSRRRAAPSPRRRRRG